MVETRLTKPQQNPEEPTRTIERTTVDTVLDITQIQTILPHRYPFLLVDRIIEYEPGKRVIGLKNVSINEPFFQGHFPGAPVTPGVLMLASLPDRETKLVFFTGIDGAKFRKPVIPGDQLRLELDVLRLRPRYIRLRGRAFVGGQLVAEAEISSSLVDRSLVERSQELNHAAFTPIE